MSTLAELCAKAPKTPKRQRVKSLRSIKKGRIRMAKFANRKGCYVVMVNFTKCLTVECGRIANALRIACPTCQNFLIEWGSLINTGKIEKNRFKCAVQQSEFITNHELRKRLISGERFFEAGVSNPKEISVQDFQNSEFFKSIT